MLKYSIHCRSLLLGFLSVLLLVCFFRGRWVFFFDKRVLCSMTQLEIIQKYSLDSCWLVVSLRLWIRILLCHRKQWGSGNSSIMNTTLVSVHQVCLFLFHEGSHGAWASLAHPNSVFWRQEHLRDEQHETDEFLWFCIRAVKSLCGIALSVRGAVSGKNAFNSSSWNKILSGSGSPKNLGQAVLLRGLFGLFCLIDLFGAVCFVLWWFFVVVFVIGCCWSLSSVWQARRPL